MYRKSLFPKNWKKYGFEGEPLPGFDYSWIFVQKNLTFVGFDEIITNCELYYSSRRNNLFLIKAENKSYETWNTKNIEFSLLADNGSILNAKCNGWCLHVSNVIYAFINLLITLQKLPDDCLSEYQKDENASGFLKPIKLNVDVIRKVPEIPTEATKIEDGIDHLPAIVCVTGSVISTNIQGKIDFKSNHEICVMNENQELWKIDFASIVKVESTKIGRIFVVIHTNEGKRFEIGFNEINSMDANDLIKALKDSIAEKEAKSQSQEADDI